MKLFQLPLLKISLISTKFNLLAADSFYLTKVSFQLLKASSINSDRVNMQTRFIWAYHTSRFLRFCAVFPPD